MLRVAYQGAPGAYSEEAVRSLWPDAEPVPLRENMDVARAVERGNADAGVLAVENTLAGSVLASYDAIVACASLFATAETVVPIHHCVLGMPGAALGEVRWVDSHPVALAQCTGFFERNPQLAARAAFDTAGAAEDVARARDPRRAALAGIAAARHYGLEILEANVEDRADNQTRFLALERAPAPLPDAAASRSVLLLETANIAGALHAVLTPFAEHGINLSKLESRPTGEPWSYRFIMELEHRAGDAAMARALAAVRGVTRSCRVVGTFPVTARD